MRPHPGRRSLLARGLLSGFRGGKAKSGFTLIEVLIALPIIAVAASLLCGTIVAARNQTSLQRDRRLASLAARSVLERMRNEKFEDIFPLYNAEPFDDPGGPGTAPGARFAVVGLAAEPDDPEPRVGEILLPVLDVSDGGPAPIWQVREDLDLPELSMPRDLNLDHILDAKDHSADYKVLPVRIVIRWQGDLGPRSFVLDTVLTEYAR
jgi:prepilin-type N-terminal cleavage/methylation domain-containing protein